MIIRLIRSILLTLGIVVLAYAVATPGIQVLYAILGGTIVSIYVQLSK